MRFDMTAGATVVTGAGGGIGRALAAAIVRRNGAVALVDRDVGALRETAALLARPGAEVSLHVGDITKPAAVELLRDEILAAHPSVTCLINNAGIGMIGRIDQITIDEMAAVFDVNFWGAVRMTLAFLPHLKEREAAQIANVASVLALIALPEQAPYTASKFALRGFDETLAIELARTRVGVTTIYPGGVATGIAGHARIAAAADPDRARARLGAYAAELTLSPADAAEQMVRGIEARRARVIVGKDARRADLLQRLSPHRYWLMIANRIKDRDSFQ